MGVGLLFGTALACEAKANLHPLRFYTIEFTSPHAVDPTGKDWPAFE